MMPLVWERDTKLELRLCQRASIATRKTGETFSHQHTLPRMPRDASLFAFRKRDWSKQKPASQGKWGLQKKSRCPTRDRKRLVRGRRLVQIREIQSRPACRRRESVCPSRIACDSFGHHVAWYRTFDPLFTIFNLPCFASERTACFT